MKTFILILSIFSSISAFGAYYISIGDNDNLNNSIVSTGGGNNYYNKSLNELGSTFKGICRYTKKNTSKTN